MERKTYSSNEQAAGNRAGLEDQLSKLTGDRNTAQSKVDRFQNATGHQKRVLSQNQAKVKELDPQISGVQKQIDASPASASDAQKFRHNQLLDKFDNAGGGHNGRNIRARTKTQLEGSQTKIDTALANEAKSAPKATETSAPARELDRFQKAGTTGRASQLKSIAKDDIASAKDNVAKAADKMEGTVKNAVADGQLRRSEMLEMAADDAGFQAAGKDLGAAKSLGKQADAMKNAAADGKITTKEQSTIDKHRSNKLEARDDAAGLRKDETALRGEAQVARHDELKGDIAALKERRAENLPKIREDYKTALGNYREAVADAGGHAALKNAPPEVRDRVEGLRMQKDGAFQAVRASIKSGSMIRDAEAALADGKVSTTEMAGLDKQVKQINTMYNESDQLKGLGQAVTQQANANLAQKAISTGNIKDLFTQPWGKELLVNAFQQQMMMQMGYPMQQQGQGFDMNQGFGRSMFDMQAQMQQMQMMSLFSGGNNNFNFGQMPFQPGQMDFSQLGMF